MKPEEIFVWRQIAIVFCIVATLWFLAVVLCREWVKTDLRNRICDPLRNRWRPFAWQSNRLTCSFRVVYSDFRGRTHYAICWTDWDSPRVTWDEDEIIDCKKETVAEPVAGTNRRLQWLVRPAMRGGLGSGFAVTRLKH